MPKKINITTKTGDNGTSMLFSGERVSKNHARLEAYGDLDELVSLLGVARGFIKSREIKKDILDLQRDIFLVSSELATTKMKLTRLPRRVNAAFLARFEKRHEALYKKTSIPRGFIIPGGSLASAYLDLARAVVRRCERKIVKLSLNKEIQNDRLLVWINRASDYIYLMARFVEKKPTLVK